MQISNHLRSSNIASDLGLDPASAKSNQRQAGVQDQVQISSLALQLAGDPTKLSQLQAACEAGTYNVSPSQIASSMINDVMLS
jgi:anti-sigma28 factor (negative regulator of flagellin synthesis)